MDAAANPSPRRIGRYEIHEAFARGGMASVHIGRLTGPVGFSRTVAIKCLYPQFAKDASFVRMFIDEARLASHLRHPNLVPILDVLIESGELYLVMDYVRGLSLSALLEAALARAERVPVPIATSLMIGLLSGLHAAHEATSEGGEPLGIVHRDVSPQNVMVGEDGVARLLDFGVAKAASRVQSTAVGQIKGKIAYMAPEQIEGRAVDRRSDAFAACVVFWEMLVGRPLFRQAEAAATMHAALNAPIPPARAHREGLSPELDAALSGGLARRADDRPATCLALIEQLERAGPVASPREVAEWVRVVAGPVLDARASSLSRLEASLATAPVPAAPPAPEAVPAPPSAPVDASVAVRAEPALAEGAAPFVAASSPGAPRRRVAALFALAATVTALVASAWAYRASRAPGEPVEGTLPSRPPDEPVAAIEAPPASAPAMALPPAPTPSSAPPSGGTRTKAGPRAAGRAPRAVAPSNVDRRAQCRVVHPDGTLGFRPECLQ